MILINISNTTEVENFDTEFGWNLRLCKKSAKTEVFLSLFELIKSIKNILNL